MTLVSLTHRERSLIGLGIATALAVAGYVYVVAPLMDRQHELTELIPAREATLEHRRLLVAQRARLAAELETTTTRLQDESSYLLPGPTAPLAASQLQKFVKDVAARASVEARSERVLPAMELAGLQEVPIEITVAGNVRETVTLLYHLQRRQERAAPLVTLKSLRIRVTAVGQPRGLVTTLTVAGYLLPPGQASKTTKTVPGAPAPVSLTDP